MKLKFKRKPRTGIWVTRYHYPHYPVDIKKVVIRYPETWEAINQKIKEIEKIMEGDKNDNINKR